MKMKKILLISVASISSAFVITSVGAISAKVVRDKNVLGLVEELQEELKAVEFLAIKDNAKELKELFASQINDASLLTTENIDLVFKDRLNKSLDPKIKISYELIPNEDEQKAKSANDDEGSLLVRIKLQVDSSITTQDIKLNRFKTLIQSIKTNDLNLKVLNKDKVLASELFEPKQNSITKQLELVDKNTNLDLDNYNLTYESLFLNDLEGRAKIRVNATLKTNENIKNHFDFVLENFKKFALDESLLNADFTLTKQNQTIQELQNAIAQAFSNPNDSNANSLEKLSNHLDIKVPEGFEFEFVSLEPKNNDFTIANLSYKLVVKNLHNADEQNPNSKNGILKSQTKSIELSSFVDYSDELLKLMDKISKVVLSQNSKLKETLPSKIEKDKLNLDNLKILTTNGKNDSDFQLLDGYNLDFDIVKNEDRNDVEGSLNLKITLSKDGKQSKSKTLVLSGLLSEIDLLKNNSFKVEIPNKQNILASDLISNKTNVENVIKKDLQIKDLENFDFANYQRIFKAVFVNDKEGKLTLKMNLISKEKNKKKDFTFEISGFKTSQVLPMNLLNLKNVKMLTVDEIFRSLNQLKNLPENTKDQNSKQTLKNLFDVVLDSNYEFNFVDFKAKENAKDVGLLTYFLKDKKTNIVSTNIEVGVSVFESISKAIEDHLSKIVEALVVSNSSLTNKLATEFKVGQKLENSMIQLYDKNKNLIKPTEGFELSYVIANNPNYDLKNGTVEIEVQYKKNNTVQKVTKKLSGFKKLEQSDFDVVAKRDILNQHPRVLKDDKTNFNFIKNTLSTKTFDLKFKNNQQSNEILNNYDLTIENVKYKNISGQVNFDIKFTKKNGSKNDEIIFNKTLTGLKADLIFKDFHQYYEGDETNHRIISVTAKLPRNQFIQKIVEARENNDIDALVDYWLKLIAPDVPGHIKSKKLTFLIRTSNLGSTNSNKGAHRVDYLDQSAEQFTIFRDLDVSGFNKSEVIKNHLKTYLSQYVFAIRKNNSKTPEEFKNEYNAARDSNSRIRVIQSYYNLYIPQGYEITIDNNNSLKALQYKFDNRLSKEDKFSDYELTYNLKKGNQTIQRKTILSYGQKVFLPIANKNGLNFAFIKKDYLGRYSDDMWRWHLKSSLKQIKYRWGNKEVFFYDVKPSDFWIWDKGSWRVHLTVRTGPRYGQIRRIWVNFRLVDGKIQIWGDHPIDGMLLAE